MTKQCPFCHKMHNSETYDEDWYFVCCGHARLVWTRKDSDDGKTLELRPVPEDMVLNGDEE